jgi:hypothetical protein
MVRRLVVAHANTPIIIIFNFIDAKTETAQLQKDSLACD